MAIHHLSVDGAKSFFAIRGWALETGTKENRPKPVFCSP